MDNIPSSALPDSETSVAHSPAEKPTLPNLDGIRAMACLMVLLSHMPWPVHFETLGETGVGLFFVLSGFLMGYLHADTPWDYASVARYSIARFARIAPIYWLAISVCVAISYYDPGSDFILKILGETAIARHYLFGGNVSIFWSIPLEIQFYVFFLLLWFGVAMRSQQPVVLPLVILLCAGLLLTHNLWPGLMLPNKLHFFLAGAIAGLVPRNSWTKVVDRRYLVYLQAAALALVLLPIWLYDSKPAFYKATELGIALAVAIYLLAVPSAWTTALFASPLMRRIGQASFSIYLMHMLVLQYGAHLLGLSMTHYDALWPVLALFGVALPMLVSRLVEIPLQRITRRALVGLLVDRKPRSGVVLNTGVLLTGEPVRPQR